MALVMIVALDSCLRRLALVLDLPGYMRIIMDKGLIEYKVLDDTTTMDQLWTTYGVI